MSDFIVGDIALPSRLVLGTARFPSPAVLLEAIAASGSGMVTAALRRQSPEDGAGKAFWDLLNKSGARVLPNTAGCRTAREAITTARMAREIFDTNRIKLEVIGDDYTLEPEPVGLVEAARVLVKEGFEVWPYTTEHIGLARDLVEAGCCVVMPWAAPIGSGQGLIHLDGLRALRESMPGVPLIVDAGIGKPSEAARVMELGYDGVLINSAIALATDPVQMAAAFARAVEAGRAGFEAGLMNTRQTAQPSTPTLGTPFWHQETR